MPSPPSPCLVVSVVLDSKRMTASLASHLHRSPQAVEEQKRTASPEQALNCRGLHQPGLGLPVEARRAPQAQVVLAAPEEVALEEVRCVGGVAAQA